MSAKGSIIHGRDLRGYETSCDVVVVGSGAGGAVAAAHLAEAGKRVIVLEEGPHYTPEEMSAMRPSEVMRRTWREAGLLAVAGLGQTPMIGLTVGRNVGGSSSHTGGVCFRIPGSVHEEWVKERGMPELNEKAFEGFYEDVEKRIQVREVPKEKRSPSTNLMVEGAKRTGVEMNSLRRNVVDCAGSSRCNFGCPNKSKMSVDISYLPGAIERGTQVTSDALVEKIRFKGKKAVGVEGRLLSQDKGRSGPRFRVFAKQVVLACGTLHTPLLLHKSGIRTAHVGKHVTVHPSLRLTARFGHKVDGWDGAMQSVYSDHYAEDGITLVGVYSTVNVLGAALPGAGPPFRKRVRQMPYMATLGALVHDDGGGTIRPDPFGGREGILSYRMAPRDLGRLRRAISIMSEIALESGAEEVFTPVFGVDPIKSMSDVRKLENSELDARRMECIAFHPLGSARMGARAQEGVTDAWGRVYDCEGLYVADGSVLPSSIGVNSQLPIMAMATRIAQGMLNAA